MSYRISKQLTPSLYQWNIVWKHLKRKMDWKQIKPISKVLAHQAGYSIVNIGKAY